MMSVVPMLFQICHHAATMVEVQCLVMFTFGFFAYSLFLGFDKECKRKGFKSKAFMQTTLLDQDADELDNVKIEKDTAQRKWNERSLLPPAEPKEIVVPRATPPKKTLSNLRGDLLLLVAEQLPARDVEMFSACSKNFRKLSTDANLWCQKCQQLGVFGSLNMSRQEITHVGPKWKHALAQSTKLEEDHWVFDSARNFVQAAQSVHHALQLNDVAPAARKYAFEIDLRDIDSSTNLQTVRKERLFKIKGVSWKLALTIVGHDFNSWHWGVYYKQFQPGCKARKLSGRYSLMAFPSSGSSSAVLVDWRRVAMESTPAWFAPIQEDLWQCADKGEPSATTTTSAMQQLLQPEPSLLRVMLVLDVA